MYKIKVNEKFEFQVNSSRDSITVNSSPINLDIYPINGNTFHILYNNRSFNAELISLDRQLKTCSVRVNSQIYSLSLTDRFDELLHQLGMDNLNAQKVSELKAPMPGMVLKVLVSDGEEVKKGSALLILEAMKMENVIKSPADVIVKSIKVQPADKVEKNQVMMVFS